MSELKPCPFCKQERRVREPVKNDPYFVLNCHDCGVRIQGVTANGLSSRLTILSRSPSRNDVLEEADLREVLELLALAEERSWVGITHRYKAAISKLSRALKDRDR